MNRLHDIFLAELHRRYQLNAVEFLVDDADNLSSVRTEGLSIFR